MDEAFTDCDCLPLQASSPTRHLLSQRQLHRAPAKTYTCDAKCETQVGLGQLIQHKLVRCSCLYSPASTVHMSKLLTSSTNCVPACVFSHLRHYSAQVKLLEAVILAITLITALITGSCMLNNLGTPTRFETPKDSLSRD